MSKSVLIATPMYGGMCTGQYTQGLINTIAVLRNRNISVHWAFMSNESLITRARNELARMFMESECTHLMFIDADIAFTGSDVFSLLDTDYAIACGVYPKKSIDWDNVKQHADTENPSDYAGSFVLNLVNDKAVTGEDGFISVRHGGTGFMLIKREVFKVMEANTPQYRKSTERGPDGEYIQPLTYNYFDTSIDDNGALLSEDYHFCERWRKEFGGSIHANPFLKLSHVGTYVYGGDLLKAGGNLK